MASFEGLEEYRHILGESIVTPAGTMSFADAAKRGLGAVVESMYGEDDCGRIDQFLAFAGHQSLPDQTVRFPGSRGSVVGEGEFRAEARGYPIGRSAIDITGPRDFYLCTDRTLRTAYLVRKGRSIFGPAIVGSIESPIPQIGYFSERKFRTQPLSDGLEYLEYRISQDPSRGRPFTYSPRYTEQIDRSTGEHFINPRP